MLQSNGRPERILLCGKDGSGKTKAYWDIAEWLNNTGSPAQMFVLDPDYKARFDPRHPLPNVHIYDELEHWQDYKSSAIKARGEGVKGRGDWLVVDMANRVWDAAQAGYAEMAFGVDVDDFYVAWRKQDTAGGNPFNADWGKDWQAINRLYDMFMFQVTRFPGNVLMTTAVDTITEQEKDREVIRKYSKWGVKPAGQKRLGHIPADLILLQETANGWSMSQMRGTGREAFKNEPFGDFVTAYLVGKAGWSL